MDAEEGWELTREQVPIHELEGGEALLARVKVRVSIRVSRIVNVLFFRIRTPYGC